MNSIMRAHYTLNTPWGQCRYTLPKPSARHKANTPPTIEKELLAVCFGCNRFHDYIFGKNITVETDHKQLVNSMAKPIHKLSPRMQQMCMRLQNYDISLTHIKVASSVAEWLGCLAFF